MSRFKFKYLVMVLFAVFAVTAIGVSVKAYEWTGWTSEEYEPRTCDLGKFQSGFACWGSYCDWVNLRCDNPGIANITNRYWLSQISEEAGVTRYCRWGDFVSGISTSGRYSDNISLECTDATGVIWDSCRWSDWKSEENGGILRFPYGYYAVGVQCSGRYCDNKRFRICQPK